MRFRCGRPWAPAGALGAVLLLAPWADPRLAAAPQGPGLSVPLATADRTILRLDLPGAPALEEIPGTPYRRVRLEGYGSLAAPGQPALPRRVYRVAIPPGARPSLSFRVLQQRRLAGVRPAPVPSHDVLHLPDDGLPPRPGIDTVERLAEGPEYVGPGHFPASAVRLGEVGQLRRQRYVEVEVMPAAWDPEASDLLWISRIEVEILHPAPAGLRRRPAREPGWEAVYRRSLVNYQASPGMRVAPETEALALQAATPLPDPAWKLQVSAEGVYRLDQPTLAAAAPALVAEDPRTWHLTLRGVEQPIRVVGEADGSFDPADYLEFYGIPRTEPDMVLEADLTPMASIYRETDVGGAHVYLLYAAGAPGGAARVTELPAAPDPVSPLPPETTFVTTARIEAETVFLPLGGDDAWYWGPRTNSLFVSGGVFPAVRTESLDLPGRAAVSYAARVRAWVRGTNSLLDVSPDHLARFSLNGMILDEVAFDGETVAELDVTVDQAAMLPDPSSMEITALPVFNGPTEVPNEFILERFEVTYLRDFDAAGGSLRIEVPDAAAGFTVTGLPDPDVVVYEVGGTVGGSAVPAPVLLTGAQVGGTGPYSASFEIAPAGAGARTLFVTTGGLAVVPPVAQDSPSNLADSANGAGYLIVTHPDLVDTTGGSAFNQFVAARAAQGLPVAVAMVDDIYDEFADSLPGPEGIAAFLAHVFTQWQGWDGDGDLIPDPPRYVLFLGDASLDYRARFSYGPTLPPHFNKVPTAIFYQLSPFLSWFSADNWLGAVAGPDRMPDFFLGRISTRSAAETEAVLAKVLAYEAAPPPGAWRSHASFLADKGKSPIETGEFERIAGDLEADFIVPPYTSSHLYYSADFGGTDAAGMKAAILAEFNSGTAMLDFVGHGAFDLWGLDRILQVSDFPGLTNGGQLPLVVVENCLSGGFAWHAGTSMGEGLVNLAGDGAIAAFSPAGLSNPIFSETVARAVYGAILGPDKERGAGEAAAAALAELSSFGNYVELMSYSLSGDPATRLALPAPAEPQVPAAVPGNTVVHLSWGASPDPVAGYHVYRATTPSGFYTRLTPTPVAATTYDDLAVQNTRTYYYGLTAVDSQGFESAWSNQNRDCAVDGPDCVRATPFNDQPPTQPTGVAAQNPGSGGRIIVSWAPNPEVDIALYRVHYGIAPGNYSGEVVAGAPTTQALVQGLTNDVVHYFAVQAENLDGLAGPLSAEVTAIPSLLQGIRPPATVSGLMVQVAGDDPASLDLSWTPVTEDIYGAATTVASYEIYAGPAASFVPTLGVPEGEVLAPASAWRDVGAATDGLDHYYLVAAVDAEGHRSGLGRDLPQGISGLAVSLEPDETTVRLEWATVETTVSGGATLLNGYRIYGSAAPFSRDDVGSMTPLGSVGGSPYLDVPPAGKVYYYSVLVEDSRGALSPF